MKPVRLAEMAQSADREATAPRGRPFRVSLVTHGLVPGGAERILCGLAGHWARTGRAVSVVTIASRDEDVHELPAGVHRVALDLASPSGSIWQALGHTALRWLALRRALVGLTPDVVIGFLSEPSVLTLLAMLGTGVPVIVCERTDPRQAKLGRPWAALRRVLYPRSAGVVVQTDSVAAWARSFCPRVAVIPNFVERPPRAATPHGEPGPKVLIAAGRLVPVKGFDLLVQAFASIAGDFPEWSLCILGDGPERPGLQALVDRFQLGERVKMPGSVADVMPQMAAAHAFVLSSRLEGFPNVLLEAMACGLPVVAFDCPSGPSDIVTHEHDGLLVPAGDVDRLSAAMAQVMSRPADRERMGRNAREIATRLAPERILEIWSALLQPFGG